MNTGQARSAMTGFGALVEDRVVARPIGAAADRDDEQVPALAGNVEREDDLIQHRVRRPEEFEPEAAALAQRALQRLPRDRAARHAAAPPMRPPRPAYSAR